MVASPDRTFGPDGRFQVVRELGRGGMGVVFEVEDRADGRHVALKALRHLAPELMYRLKREFRAASELVHPNVISLYELFVDGDDCCFTMELVEGVDILAWVGIRDYHAELPSGAITRPRSSPACDPYQLRPALYQLALGIDAIHRAGLVHRDIKPSNVLVDLDGMVRVLDLGLAADAPASADSRTGQMVGTLAYMAPEAARGARPAPAQDWYAFGTIIYQAITGWLPYGGSFAQLLERKLTTPPPPPGAVAVGVPSDLDELCRLLLVPDPDQRPSGEDIVHRLAARLADTPSLDGTPLRERVFGAAVIDPSSGRLVPRDLTPDTSSFKSGTVPMAVLDPSSWPAHGAGAAPLFAGRTAELARLAAALERVERGRSAIIHVKGPSGIGKTELIREALRRARSDNPRVVALHGRCYPHERVSYRAIDPLIDNLSRLWTALPDVDAHLLIPRHTATLLRLFPVLARVAVLASQPEPSRPVSVDEERRRGHAALREVMQRLGDLRTLVLVLDDVHLIDASTVDLLIDIVREPDAPVALMVMVSWTDRAPAEAGGRHIDDPLEVLVRELGNRVETIELPPLGHDEAVTLAGNVLGAASAAHSDGADADGDPAARAGPRPAVDLDALVREAGGLPFFVIELARFVQKEESVDLASLRVDRVVAARLDRLHPSARRLLETIAVAGAPTPRRVAAVAAGLGSDEEVRRLRALRLAGLVRTEGSGDDETVEPYHDRIRGAVCVEMSHAQLVARHRALALAFELSADPPADRLALHWLGAGETERACANARRAASLAEAELDFARAAELYQIVLDHAQLSVAERVKILGAMGEAHSCTGRTNLAAQAFLAAAELANPVASLRLRSCAASELLRGGDLEHGVTEIEHVLRALGMKLAATPRRALLNLIRARVRARLRGFRFTPRRTEDIDPLELVRLDACYAVGMGLSMVDHLRGAEYNTRGLLYALQVGEPARLARAMFLEIGSRAGHGDRKGALRLAARTRALGEPLCDAYALLGEGAVATLLDCDWPGAVDKLERAMEGFREAGRAAGWEHDNCQTYRIYCLFWMGELAEIARSLPDYLHQAQRRGDRYGIANMRSRNNTYLLTIDQPERALEDLEDALAGWPRPVDTYHLQNYYSLLARCDIALYSGAPEQAAGLLAAELPALRAAHLLHVVSIRRDLSLVQARVALAQSAGGHTHATSEATRIVRVLSRSRQPVVGPLSRLFSGLLADLRGDRADAERDLRRAVGELDRLSTHLYAATARWRLGEVIGDAGMIAAASEELAERGVRNPPRLVQMMAPSRRG